MTIEYQKIKIVKKRHICENTEAAKKKKEDSEMAQALNHMIQAAQTMDEATKTVKTIDQGIHTDPLPSPSPTEPPTPAEPYSLSICPFHLQETLKFKCIALNQPVTSLLRKEEY